MASGMSTAAIKMACWLHSSCPGRRRHAKKHRCQIWQFRRAAVARCVRAKSKRVWFLRLDPRDMPWSHRELGAAAVLRIARGVLLTAVARGSTGFVVVYGRVPREPCSDLQRGSCLFVGARALLRATLACGLRRFAMRPLVLLRATIVCSFAVGVGGNIPALGREVLGRMGRPRRRQALSRQRHDGGRFF